MLDIVGPRTERLQFIAPKAGRSNPPATCKKSVRLVSARKARTNVSTSSRMVANREYRLSDVASPDPSKAFAVTE